MKDYFKFVLSALCLLSFAIVLSCSDDNDPVFRVDNEVTKGIKADVFDNLYTFNLESSGEWTASLPENCDWARVMQKKGIGSSKVEILVDGNDTGIDRKTVINIASGNQSIEIPLEQTASMGGDAPVNDAEYIMLAGKKYLGYGCDLMQFIDAPHNGPLKYKPCNIVNVKAIDNLMRYDEDGDYYSLATTNKLNLTDYEDARLDTIIAKEDSLGISLCLDIAYGVMKFGIKGGYVGKEDFKSKYIQIHTAANYPVLEASINVPEIFSHYEDWQEEGRNDNDFRSGLVTQGFANLKDSLKKHCAEQDGDAQRNDIKLLIRDFGSGVITRSKLGGMIALDMLLDSIFIDEKYKMDTAKVEFDIQVGGFSLGANVQVDYLNDAKQLFENSRHKVSIIGGKRSNIADIINLFNKARYGTDLTNSINAWAKTIDYDNKTAQLIGYDVVPIWNLFDDRASRTAIIDYFRDAYPNSKFVKKYITDKYENTGKK